jgi:hypothetical protein
MTDFIFYILIANNKIYQEIILRNEQKENKNRYKEITKKL